MVSGVAPPGSAATSTSTARLSRTIGESQRLSPMLGLKSFRTAAVVISGIELAEKVKKGQYKIGKLGGPTATMPAIWQAALAA